MDNSKKLAQISVKKSLSIIYVSNHTYYTWIFFDDVKMSAVKNCLSGKCYKFSFEQFKMNNYLVLRPVHIRHLLDMWSSQFSFDIFIVLLLTHLLI